MDTNRSQVTACRDGKFWCVEIPQLDGAKQGCCLSEVEEMARDYIATYLDIDPKGRSCRCPVVRWQP